VLVDFGLSGRQLRPGCGTLEYCAPEVLGLVESKTPQPADMYAFACTAFEALSFELLFDAEDETSILSALIGHDGWPDKLARLAHIPESAEIARLLAACLRRDPKNRPTASQARRALRDLTPKLTGVSFRSVPRRPVRIPAPQAPCLPSLRRLLRVPRAPERMWRTAAWLALCLLAAVATIPRRRSASCSARPRPTRSRSYRARRWPS
jgi:serine/threonine protein kinase